MVLSRGNKNTAAREAQHKDLHFPPPPYQENDTRAPIVLAETRTTTRTEVVTTTTQTTHFFSLPLWRRRPATSTSSSTRPSFSAADESGLITNGGSSDILKIEKDLPPTPTMSQETHRDTGEVVRQSDRLTDCDAEASLSEVTLSPSKSSDIYGRKIIKGPPQPTMALARASLGLGLTDIRLQPSSSTSSLDINTVAFTENYREMSSDAAVASMRRTKSSQKLRTAISSSAHDSSGRTSVENGGTMRKRVISMGTNSMFQSIEKGKGKETDESVGQSLARRPSFWSRRKKDAPPPPPTASDSMQPSLLSVIPVSPLIIDLAATSSPTTSQPRSPRLSRSLSERGSSHSPSSPRTTEFSIYETLPSPKRSPRSPMYRPATADSTAQPSPREPSLRPTTADASLRYPTRVFSADPSSLRPELPSMKPSITLPSQQMSSQDSHASHSPTSQRRPRAQTNPPLLHRLSVNLFSSSGPVSTTKSSGVFGPNMFTSSSPIASTSNSPRPSTSKKPVEVPKPHLDDESPEAYIERLLHIVSAAEIAGILASSGDQFYVRALRSYIERFNFKNDPLDVALRKLLMEVGLPRETQQIDRVVEAFAGQYVLSNPNLFASEDHPYILAFSLIMLHTDAFNKSNKRKMTKPDYVKNTRLPGVAPEVLDCFFDNIVFAPFIFIEDPLDVNGQRGLQPESASAAGISKSGSQNPSPVNGSSGTLLGKGKIDPYYLITHHLLDPLRVPVETYVPFESPYSYRGTGQPWDEEDLQNAFARAAVIEIGGVDNYKVASPFFGLSVGGVPSPMGSMGALPEILPATGEIWTLKVTKVGLLNRKDDTIEGGKKAMNRKWKPWSVILTGSQLLMFRDPSWATNLLAQSDLSEGQVIYPQTTMFKPDELLSVKDAVAVFDKSYVKYPNTLRFVAHDGRQFFLRSSDEKELNEWISRINYASAFKSAGVRMRAPGMSGKDVELTGVAAATSHLHDMQHQKRSTNKVHSWDGEAAHDLMDMLSGGNDFLTTKKRATNRRVTMMTGRADMDLDVPIAPEIEGAHQFKVTFDQVKAELAAGNWSSSEESSETDDKPSDHSSESVIPTRTLPVRGDSLSLPSRSQIIQSKIRDLESRITALQSSLENDLRFVRNVATLTPFQKATRDRLQIAVQGVSKRVMQVRIDLARLTCHRDVLAGDLVAEERDLHRAKDLAFRAATETLQSRREKNVPRMTLSFHDEGALISPEALPSAVQTPSHKADSSIAESFHSALDFGSEWLSSDDLSSSTFLEPSRVADSPCPSSPLTPGGTLLSDSYPFPEVDSNVIADTDNGARNSQSSPLRNSDDTSHERFYTAPDALEEAEEWDKTRAAKRVSLVRVPSGIRPSSRFAKQSRQTDIEEDTAVSPDTTDQ